MRSPHPRRPLLALVAALLLAAGPAQAGSRSAAWPHGSAVVGYRTQAALAAALQAEPGRVLRRLPALHAVEVRPAGDPGAFAAALRRLPGIAYVERLAPRAAHVEPGLAPSTLPGGAYEWQYAASHVDAVPQSVLDAAKGLTIAVIDTGADLTAPDLAAKAPASWSVLASSTDVTDPNGHGTFVAALAAGSPSNGEGMAGFGGEARLLVLQAGNSTGDFSDLDEAAAIVYAVDHGARIVNLSLGGTDTSATERAAIDYAAGHGVLLVAAAGNEFAKGNPVEYPAALLQPAGSNGQGGVGLSVAASDQSGAWSGFSNTGSFVSLAAPGKNVFSALPTGAASDLFLPVALPGSHAGTYGFGSGTSFAAPEVAGAAALVWAADPLLSATSVAAILKQTASGRGAWNAQLGYGSIDVAAAVQTALQARLPQASVSLRGERLSGGRVKLTWSGIGAAFYRVSLSKDSGSAELVTPSTTETSAVYTLPLGHRYVFTVAAIDGTGNEAAHTAPYSVLLPRSGAVIRIGATPHGGKAPLDAVVTLRLVPLTAGLAVDGRTVELQGFSDGGWRHLTSALVGSDGRAAWNVDHLPAGVYRLRARYFGAEDLSPATSRTVVLSVRR